MDTLNLESILQSRLGPGTKGLPAAGEDQPIADIGRHGWNLLDGDIPLPACIIRSSILAANLARFHNYIAKAGVFLAPHGKTTMCPQLYDRQIRAGAWGITVATYAQARVALNFGVKRLLIANELVGKTEIRTLSGICDSDDDLMLISLVDSLAGARRLNDILAEAEARRPFCVLVELGLESGRTGLRDLDEARDVARLVHALPYLRLAGVEAYEGLIVSGDPTRDALEVDAFLDRLIALHDTCRSEQLYIANPIISAGGSAYFDLVARGLSVEGVTPLLRSGCYVTHDNGFYDALLQHIEERAVLGTPPKLESALEVWAQVLSRPEDDLIIIGAGRRDLADDAGAPKVLKWSRQGGASRPHSVTDWTFFRMNDQHGYVRVPGDVDVQIGDYVGIGISHPCTTFDKWPLILEVDDHYAVIGGLRTFF